MSAVDVEQLVLVDQQCVTFKWLAYEKQTSMEAAKALLAEFVAKHTDSSKVDATYLITGHIKGSTDSHSVCVVSASKLNQVRSSMDRITSEHVYSVQPAAVPDTSTALWNKTNEKLIEMIEGNDEDSSSLLENKLSSISLSQKSVVGQKRVLPPAPPKNVPVMSSNASNRQAKVEDAYKHVQGTGGKKKTSAMSFFQKHSKPKAKKEPNEPKVEATNRTPPATSESTSMPEPKIKSEKALTEAASSKHETAAQPVAMEQHSDSEDEMEFDEPSPVQSKPSQQSPATTKRKVKDEPHTSETGTKEPLPAKKAKVLDSDDESEEDEDEATKAEIARVEAERKELEAELEAEKARKKEERRLAAKAEREEELREKKRQAKERGMQALGIAKTSQTPQTPAGQKKTRMVKRQKKVTQETEDEDGFLVVKEVIVEEEVEEEIPESELTASHADKKKSSPLASQSSAKSKTSAAKSQSQSQSQPSKQGKLSMFFKKK
eukprot:CAMPEP_0184546482 /NCGR_PEP_ID=MMETSP0199_2-20130426/4980_1 /TAXON_ID=1112570 /ORGANISM="Thraustochytrium sp., Strain LLF1b" /LENGTH=490 /DNA_ID=CAMNT_0026940893 /DNA_START=431 /DNA_END=1903 /DNA_ORIENTATION=-